MCGHAQTISNSEAHMQMAKLAALQCSQRPALIGTCSAATGGEACHCKNSAVPKQDYHRIQTLSQALHKCSVFKRRGSYSQDKQRNKSVGPYLSGQPQSLGSFHFIALLYINAPGGYLYRDIRNLEFE